MSFSGNIGATALKGITNSIPGGGAAVAIAQALGVGKRSHVSVTFYDIYGKIQHTNTEAERDSFLANQRSTQAKQNLKANAQKALPFALIAVGGLLLIFVLKK